MRFERLPIYFFPVIICSYNFGESAFCRHDRRYGDLFPFFQHVSKLLHAKLPQIASGFSATILEVAIAQVLIIC